MELSEIVRRFDVDRKISETSYQCKCPAHDDNKASLTITEKDGKILMHCHAGCDTTEVAQAVGLSMRNLNVNEEEREAFKETPKWQHDLVSMFDYHDEAGNYVYSKLRYKPKKFYFGYVEHEECRYKGITKERYLYNLPKLIEAVKSGQQIYIVEGEKDVETMRKLGLVATTAGGADNWKKQFAKQFKDAWVTILQDNDNAGQKLTENIIRDIKDICHCYRVVITSEQEKGDVTDYIEDGHSKEDLLKLVEAEPWITREKEKEKSLQIKTLDQVEIKKVHWLVDGFIPLHQLVTIGGDGGSAKTTMWCAIVAAISSGRPTPFEELNAQHSYIDEPQKVMFFSSEDPVSEVLKPKIFKHGGNMENIIFMDLTDDRFEEILFNSSLLEDLIAHHNPALVVFDPIQSFIPSDIQMGSRNAMRQCFNPLVGLCNKYKVTIILIAHANKSSGTWGRKRLADSADLWDISRAVFLNGKLKDGLFYISQEKNNYAPLAKTLLFNIEDGKLNPKGFTSKHDKDFVQEDQYATRQAPAKEEAKEFILETLQEHEGSVENTELMEMAEAMSISASAMKKAKAELKKEQKIALRTEGKPGKDRKNYISLLAI